MSRVGNTHTNIAQALADLDKSSKSKEQMGNLGGRVVTLREGDVNQNLSRLSSASDQRSFFQKLQAFFGFGEANQKYKHENRKEVMNLAVKLDSAGIELTDAEMNALQRAMNKGDKLSDRDIASIKRDISSQQYNREACELKYEGQKFISKLDEFVDSKGKLDFGKLLKLKNELKSAGFPSLVTEDIRANVFQFRLNGEIVELELKSQDDLSALDGYLNDLVDKSKILPEQIDNYKFRDQGRTSIPNIEKYFVGEDAFSNNNLQKFKEGLKDLKFPDLTTDTTELNVFRFVDGRGNIEEIIVKSREDLDALQAKLNFIAPPSAPNKKLPPPPLPKSPPPPLPDQGEVAGLPDPIVEGEVPGDIPPPILDAGDLPIASDDRDVPLPPPPSEEDSDVESAQDLSGLESSEEFADVQELPADAPAPPPMPGQQEARGRPLPQPPVAPPPPPAAPPEPEPVASDENEERPAPANPLLAQIRAGGGRSPSEIAGSRSQAAEAKIAGMSLADFSKIANLTKDQFYAGYEFIKGDVSTVQDKDVLMNLTMNILNHAADNLEDATDEEFEYIKELAKEVIRDIPDGSVDAMKKRINLQAIANIERIEPSDEEDDDDWLDE